MDDVITWGLISKIRAKPQFRDGLAISLAEFYREYTAAYATVVVAADASDKDVVWVTQFWESRDVHAAVMTPDLLDAYGKSAAFILQREMEIETRPIFASVTV